MVEIRAVEVDLYAQLTHNLNTSPGQRGRKRRKGMFENLVKSISLTGGLVSLCILSIMWVWA